MADLKGIEAQRESAMEAARLFIGRLSGSFAPNRRRDIAVVSNVSRDEASRARLVSATIGGSVDQPVQIDHGGAYHSGDVLLVVNDGSISAPSWRALRKLVAASPVPVLSGEEITLPTPTNLNLTVGAYNTTLGIGGSVSWVFASWDGISDAYGTAMSYEVQHARNEFVNSPYSRIVRWSQSTASLAVPIGVADTVIPRTASSVEDDFPTSGAARIAGETFFYTAGTSGQGTSGVATGISVESSNTAGVLDPGETWSPDNRWVNYCMIDSDDNVFRIVGSWGDWFLVEFGVAPPSAGAYQIVPAFCGCVRGAGGTTATVHSAGEGIVALSCGALIDGLPANVDYNVRVRAIRDDGAVSAYTAWASVTTIADTNAPDVPTDFTVTSGINEVILTWSGPTPLTDPKVANFEVFRSEAPGGTGAESMGTTGLSYNVKMSSYPGKRYYWAVRSLSHTMAASEITAWTPGTSGVGGANKLTNADFERNFYIATKPDEWILSGSDEWTMLGSSSYSYGNYGIDGGKAVRCNLVANGGLYNACQLSWPNMGPDNRLIPMNPDIYMTHSFYVNVNGIDLNDCVWFLPDEYLSSWIYIHTFLRAHDGTSWASTRLNILDDDLANIVWYDPSDSGWLRIAATTRFTDAILDPLILGGYYYLSFHIRIINKLAYAATIDIDRPQFQQGGLSDWDMGAVTYQSTMSIDPSGIASQYFKVNSRGQLAGNLVPQTTDLYSAGTAGSRLSSLHAATAQVDTVKGQTGLSLEVGSTQAADVDTAGNIRAKQDLEYDGDLRPYRNSTLYTGYTYVPLDSVATGANFAGDSFSDVTTSTLIDLSSEFGLPAGIKAIVARLSIRDSGTWGSNDLWFGMGPSATEFQDLKTYCYGGNLFNAVTGIARCDANGDVYYQCDASGTDTLEVWIRIYGYFI